MQVLRVKGVAAAAFLAIAFAGATGAAESGASGLRLAQAEGGGAGGSGGSGKSIIVFAAASLTDVLGEIDKAYTAKTGVEVKASFAASSALGAADRERCAGGSLLLAPTRNGWTTSPSATSLHRSHATTS